MALRPNRLDFFRSFKNNSVNGRKITEKTQLMPRYFRESTLYSIRILTELPYWSKTVISTNNRFHKSRQV